MAVATIPASPAIKQHTHVKNALFFMVSPYGGPSTLTTIGGRPVKPLIKV